MADTSDINGVETEDDYSHIQFQDSNQSEEIRTPAGRRTRPNRFRWGRSPRTGKLEDNDDWEVETVLVQKRVDEEKAKEQATEIVDNIES